MKSIITLLLIFALTTATAQFNYQDSNRIGINIGVNQFNLMTDDIEVTPEIGWNIGLSMRGNFYNDFDMVYGIQFSENRFAVATTTVSGLSEDVEYKLPSAQISLLLSYKIVENHLSVEFGPMLQVNGNLGFDKENEMNIVDKTTVTVDDLSEISRFNFYPTLGVTTGVRHFRLALLYQYGVNNILLSVNGNDSGKLKGNAGIASANLVIYL